MTTVKTKSGRVIKVVSRNEEKSTLTVSDNEMDLRAVEAVKAAIEKAKICKKPIAGYDKEKKTAYINFFKNSFITKKYQLPTYSISDIRIHHILL